MDHRQRKAEESKRYISTFIIVKAPGYPPQSAPQRQAECQRRQKELRLHWHPQCAQSDPDRSQDLPVEDWGLRSDIGEDSYRLKVHMQQLVGTHENDKCHEQQRCNLLWTPELEFANE